MIRIILLALIIILILVFVSMILLLNYYKKCPPGCMLIVFNNRPDEEGYTFKIIKSGGAFVWPFGGSFIIFSLSPFNVDLSIQKLTDKEEQYLQLEAKFLLAISSDKDTVERAIERFAGRPEGEIAKLAADIIEYNLQSFFAGLDESEYKDKEKLKLSLTNALILPLEDIGLTIMNLNILKIERMEA